MLLVALAAAGCVPDDWIVVPPRDAGADAAPFDASDVIDAATDVTDAPRDVATDVADVSLDAATDAADASLDGAADVADVLTDVATDVADAPLVCPTGRSACGGACVTGPVNLYRADGNANDSAGSRNGAAPRGVGYAAGRFGQAFVFGGNGAMQFVGIPPEVGDFGEGDFTLSLWINTTRDGDVFAKRPATCMAPLPFIGLDVRVFGDGHPGVDVWTSADHVRLDSTLRVTDGTWHHVAVVRAGAELDLAVDGAVMVRNRISGAMSYPPGSQGFVGVGPCVPTAPVGDGSGDGTNWFTGMIDEIGFYPRAMSEGELRDRALGLCRP